MPASAYAVLELPDNCDDDAVIKAAYRRLSLIHHPDRVQQDQKEVESRKMQEINDAYALLRDKQSRDTYNMQRQLYERERASFTQVPVFKPTVTLDFSILSDRRSLWFALANKLRWPLFASSRFLKNVVFGESHIFPLRIFSQHVFMELILKVIAAQPVENPKVRRDFVLNQVVLKGFDGFQYKEQLTQLLRQYEPQDVLKLVALKISEDDVEEGNLGDPFGAAREINKQALSMMGAIIVQAFKLRKAQVEDIQPDIQMGICGDHVLCPGRGTVLLEVQILVQEFTTDGKRAFAVLNLNTGEAIGSMLIMQALPLAQ